MFSVVSHIPSSTAIDILDRFMMFDKGMKVGPKEEELDVIIRTAATSAYVQGASLRSAGART
ncbi:hypothetical protein QJS04_geneDACA020146 [Acorus gramineus]|uniref:Uncharacterized protein n=1 Tax=Acorus gramineus TaxID=55184 RepID=A0AAV9BR35_ACOGR|nr:hypothetical protein QJS04_geneDACA020146 [Acorus gramineus]